jgi:hypothetical protein
MHFRKDAILWKLMVLCDGLKRLIEVLDSSGTDDDGLRKHVPMSLIWLADALNVPHPRQYKPGTYKHNNKHPDESKETASGSTTIPSATEVKKWLPIYCIMNESGTFCVLEPL